MSDFDAAAGWEEKSMRRARTMLVKGAATITYRSKEVTVRSGAEGGSALRSVAASQTHYWFLDPELAE